VWGQDECDPVIRIRRVPQRLPIGRLYEVELDPTGEPERKTRRTTRGPLSVIQPVLGVRDAWSFIDEADRQWDAGQRGWAVEYEERTS
jgi:hypothetical protein